MSESGLTFEFNEEQARALDANIKNAAEKLSRVKEEIGKRIFGQSEMVENTLISILAGGNVLLEGNPGLAKTLLVTTIADVIGMKSARIQYTPDTMPSDILGYELLNKQSNELEFIEGPVFTNLLLADEINRGSPRTQSALLQAMQEKEVTVNGKTIDLEPPFHVIATQNPIEQEGTNPLPEAQLDRFLMRIEIPYPDAATEFKIATMSDKIDVEEILSLDDLMQIQSLINNADESKKMAVHKDVAQFAVDLVRATRPEENATARQYISFGAGPRAVQTLIKTANVRAMMRGDDVASIDDVKALAYPVLNHRLGLKFEARMGEDSEALVKQNFIQKLVDEVDAARAEKAPALQM